MLRVESVLTGVGGSPYYQRLHFEGSTEAEAADARDAVADQWTGLFNGVNPNIARLTATVRGEVAVVNVGDGEVTNVWADDDIVVSPGSTSVAIVPNACQVMVRLNTSTFSNGRRIRGKIYYPCFNAQAMASDGNVSSTAVAQAEAAAGGLLTRGLGVYSRPQADPARIGRFTPVSSVNVWNEFAVIRSRRD